MIRTNRMVSGTSSEGVGCPTTSRRIPNRPAPIIEQDAAVLLPAPLQHRRTLNDPTAWMDNHLNEAGLIRIGLAHGAVYGFDTDEEQRANPIDPTRPELARLDYLALGDWHGELQVNERCWYSGTPETDSFQTRGRGTTLLVEIGGPNELPRITLSLNRSISLGISQ